MVLLGLDVEPSAPGQVKAEEHAASSSDLGDDTQRQASAGRGH